MLLSPRDIGSLEVNRRTHVEVSSSSTKEKKKEGEERVDFGGETNAS